MDLLLNSDTHDLELTGYDLSLVSGLAIIEQRLKQSLWFFFGEWYLDIESGVPYFQDILIKAPSKVTVEGHIKKAILETPGVEELVSFNMTYDNQLRKISLDFQVKSEFGIVNISEVV